MIKKLTIFSLAVVTIWSFSASPTMAFNKTRLIDDSLFTATGSMSKSKVQQWLNNNAGFLKNWKDTVDIKKPNGCLAHKATGKTAAQIIWEAANDWKAQYIQGCNNVKYYKDRNLRTVSPKVLLVTLQKEQSLISATGSYSKKTSDYKNPSWPSNEYALAWATGYGVPDSGGANHKYKGFYNQIYYAAWQLRFNFERSGGNVNWDTYPDDDSVGYWVYSGPMTKGKRRRCKNCALIQYDGYYPIDGKNLKMSNRATASLYYYTPHTYPGYYGNYNFVQFYKQWFGSVFANVTGYKAKLYAQSYGISMKQGQYNNVFMMFKNTGTRNWYDDASKSNGPAGTKPVRLAADKPLGRSSGFGGPWPGKKNKRVRGTFSAVYKANGTTLTTNQHVVKPGEIAKFEFQVRAPYKTKPGWHKEFLQPILEGNSKAMNDLSSHLRIRVNKAKYVAKHVGQSGAQIIKQGRDKTVFFKYKNVGNVPWYDDTGKNGGGVPYNTRPVRLAASKPFGRTSSFGASWPGSGNKRVGGDFTAVYESDGTTLASNQHKVKPGQIVKFEFIVTAPYKKAVKVYREFFAPRLEGTSKMNVLGSNLKVQVVKSKYVAQYIGQSAHPSINLGSSKSAYATYKNTGNVPWFDDHSKSLPGKPVLAKPVRLAVKPLGNASVFGASWGPAQKRATSEFGAVYESDGVTPSPTQHIVTPGEIVKFEFSFNVPSNLDLGVYREKFTPLLEVPGIMNILHTYFDVTVTN